MIRAREMALGFAPIKARKLRENLPRSVKPTENAASVTLRRPLRSSSGARVTRVRKRYYSSAAPAPFHIISGASRPFGKTVLS